MNFTVVKGTFQITFRNNETNLSDQGTLSPGFNCSIKLNYSAWKRFSGLGLCLGEIIPSDELGITPDYDLTPTLYSPSPEFMGLL
jgi:hypothetical protein